MAKTNNTSWIPMGWTFKMIDIVYNRIERTSFFVSMVKYMEVVARNYMGSTEGEHKDAYLLHKNQNNLWACRIVLTERHFNGLDDIFHPTKRRVERTVLHATLLAKSSYSTSFQKTAHIYEHENARQN